MTGSTADIIAIIPVAIISLGVWLIAMFYANSHPRWADQARTDYVAPQALEGTVPAQRLSSPGPVVPGQRVGAPADERSPEQTGAGETGRE